jgi:thymidylate synthase ThyX
MTDQSGQLNPIQPTMQNPLITAVRMWDGGAPVLPDAMLPKAPTIEDAVDLCRSKGQFAGTDLENLGEMAARICYDSAGTGRPSADFHQNILKVNHLSVYEHCVFTVEWDISMLSTWAAWLHPFLNRPSLFVRMHEGKLRATVNLRHVLEWGKVRVAPDGYHDTIGEALHHIAHELAPLVVSEGPEQGIMNRALGVAVVEPTHPQEQWITLLMTGSRGWSHELVRHGDWTAISQRSTRYVDENESPWIDHPLTTLFTRTADTVDRAPNGEATEVSVGMRAANVEAEAKRTYALMVQKLEAWLITRGIDKFTARKQARGAARGYLGNALLTEVVFSANVQQWKHMLRMRASQAADAEIRESFCKALPELKGSRYGAEFAGFSLAPAPDGIGQVVIEQ